MREIAVPRIIIFGSTGQIGWELVRSLQPLGKVIPVDRSVLNIADFNSVKDFIRAVKPQVIINAAAYTDVENASECSDMAIKINSNFPGLIASECELISAQLIHYSTDSVFDGKSNIPYIENDKTGPLNFYAETKLIGETEIQNTKAKSIILRIGWVYSLRRKNFLLAIQNKAKTNGLLKVVSDQWGSPSWARSISDLTAQIVNKQVVIVDSLSGGTTHSLYHMASPDYTNWYDFANSILRNNISQDNEVCTEIEKIKATEYASKVIRPQWSVLNSDKLWNDFNLSLPSWKAQLNLCLGVNEPNPIYKPTG